MLFQIIDANLQRIEKDLKEIEGIKGIDFIDIFPQSEEHKTLLDAEITRLSKVLEKTERGTVYSLNEPYLTKYGSVNCIKIRYFDVSRLNWEAACDFVVENRNILIDKVGKDKRFSYIKREKWDAVEFKTADTLVYFLQPLASEVYGNHK